MLHIYFFFLMLHFAFYFRVNCFLHNHSYPFTFILYYPLEKGEVGHGLRVEDQLP